MTNADIRAGYDSLNSMEDAYAFAKEGEYAGTMEDFELLCALAAVDMLQMNLDDISDYAEHACRAPRSRQTCTVSETDQRSFDLQRYS